MDADPLSDSKPDTRKMRLDDFPKSARMFDEPEARRGRTLNPAYLPFTFGGHTYGLPKPENSRLRS